MRNLYLNDYVYILLLLSFLCLGFSMALSYITNFIAFTLAIVSVSLNFRISFNLKKLIYFFLIIFPFLLSLSSLLYSVNFNLNLYKVEKLIFLVLTSFSLVFISDKKTLTNKTILLYFSFIVFTLYILSILNGLVYYNKTGSFFDYKYSNSFLEIQHNYLSIYGIFSSYILFVNMLRNKKHYLVFSFMILLMVGFIILISSRFAILLLLALIISYGLYIFLRKKNLKRFLLAMFFFSATIGFLLSSTNTLDRFKKLQVEDRSPRYSIWRCCIEIIDKHTTFFKGLGAGNVQEEINKCLITSKRNYWTGLHSHNQILGYVLAYGYLPVIIIIFVFSHFLYISYINKNHDFLFFLIILLSFGLTENYMERRYGILFYVFFTSFFVKKHLIKKHNEK